MLVLVAGGVALWTLAVLTVAAVCGTPSGRYRSGVTAVAVLGTRHCSA